MCCIVLCVDWTNTKHKSNILSTSSALVEFVFKLKNFGLHELHFLIQLRFELSRVLYCMQKNCSTHKCEFSFRTKHVNECFFFPFKKTNFFFAKKKFACLRCKCFRRIENVQYIHSPTQNGYERLSIKSRIKQKNKILPSKSWYNSLM